MAEKYVTVICTTPWEASVKYKARCVRHTPLSLPDPVVVIRFATGEDIMLSALGGGIPSVVYMGCRYELGPAWHREIGDE